MGPLIGRFIRGRTEPELYAGELEKVMPIDRIVEDAQPSPVVERPAIVSGAMLASLGVKNVAH